MRTLATLLIIFLTGFTLIQATTLNSSQDGTWSSSDTWGGAGSPSNGDAVVIDHTVTLDGDVENNMTITIEVAGSLGGPGFNMKIKSGETLTIRGYLELNDLTFDNGSIIIIEATATVVIRGNLINKNNSDNVTIDGEVTVEGNVENGNGGVIDGDGQIVVSGDFVGEGALFGRTPTSSIDPGTVASRSTLPVELVALKAAYLGQHRAEVTWSTASELNNDHFDIERSSDGYEFESISLIKGAGTSNDISDYSYVDEEVPSGTVYYRLKQVDFDGRYEYFNARPIDSRTSDSECELDVNPNPCMGKCTVAFENCDNEENENVRFKVYDAMGNVVYFSMEKSILNGQADFTLDATNNLAPAVYIIRGETQEKAMDKKVIMQP